MGLFYRVDTDFKIIKASLTQIFSDTRFQGALFHKTHDIAATTVS